MYKMGMYRLIMHYMHFFFIDMYAYRYVYMHVYTPTYIHVC